MHRSILQAKQDAQEQKAKSDWLTFRGPHVIIKYTDTNHSSYEPEAFGRVAVEAQSMQVPIIASDIGGSRETIIKDKTGYLFSNKDPNALADAIVALMKKDYNSLKSIGIEGRKNVLKKFDVDKMCQTTFTEYKKLIELS